MRTSLLALALLLLGAGCSPDILTIDDGDAGTLLPSDGLTNITRIPAGRSVTVTAVLEHEEIEGSTSAPVDVLTSDDPAVVAITQTSTGFKLEARAVGETVIHGSANGAALGPDYHGSLPVRVVAN